MRRDTVDGECFFSRDNCGSEDAVCAFPLPNNPFLFFFFFSSFFTFFEASTGAQARRVSDRGVLPASLQEAMLRGLSIYLKLACLLRVAGSTSLALSLTTLKTKKEM